MRRFTGAEYIVGGLFATWLAGVIALTNHSAQKREMNFVKHGEYEGYDVTLTSDPDRIELNIRDRSDPDNLNPPFILAIDYNRDGVDKSSLYRAGEDHPFRNLVCDFETLDKIIKDVLENGKWNTEYQYQ